LRKRAGFDVLLGNPPWQEVTVEDHAFWARHFPGLRGLPQAEMERERARLRKERPDLAAELDAEVAAMAGVRKALTSGAYPGMGTGDPDLYKAFMWRFWNLANETGGRIGVVLPRGAFSSKGSTAFRIETFRQSARFELIMLLNRKHWVFDEVHEQYLIGLVAITRGSPEDRSIWLSGPYSRLAELESAPGGVEFAASDVLSWNDTASLPVLPSSASLEVFAALRRSPRIDSRDVGDPRIRPDTELHATNQKFLMSFEASSSKSFWPVYKGESFGLHAPDNGPETYYALADPEPALQFIYDKRLRSAKSSRDSAHSEFDIKHTRDRATLAPLAPRIAFRDGTNRLNERTMIVCLVPAQRFLANTAPYFLLPKGDVQDEAFVLAVLCSRPLDWYARRFLERHANFFLVNTFPIPRPPRTDPLWQRAVALAGRLAAPDERFAKWAEKVGVEHGPLAQDIKQDMIDELDAVVAHLYGLSEAELRHVFETFHEGWDWEPRFDAVAKHFRRLVK